VAEFEKPQVSELWAVSSGVFSAARTERRETVKHAGDRVAAVGYDRSVKGGRQPLAVIVEHEDSTQTLHLFGEWAESDGEG
jgi:hypothetical protein